MAISFEQKEIALSYSENFKTLKPGWGETCADGPSMDNADYGTRLEISDNNLFFKGNFLRVGFFVTCNWNEFIDPEVTMVKINSDSDGNNGTTIFNNNVRWLIDAAASRDQGTKSDDRVLIHINIPTMAIHDKIIKSIYIKCNHGWPIRNSIKGYWNLQSSNSIKIHRAYTWSGKSLINIESTEGYPNNKGYYYTNSNTTISAYPEHYNGNVTINFVSHQTDGNTNDSYFTSNNGFMKATIKLTNYFSTLVDTNESQTKTKQYRTPYSLVLKGQDKDGDNISKTIDIGPSIITNEPTKEVELNSSHFSNFSKITDAKVTYYNGGAELDRSNDQTITNENTLVNYGITLQQDGNLVNVLNQYVTHGKDASDKQYIELQAIFNGKLTRISNCPYMFYNEAPISIKDAKQAFSGAISIKNNEILASATYNYLVSADTSVLNTRPVEPNTTYQLTCRVINLLDFDNGTLQEKKTKYQYININSLKLLNEKQSKYVAFGNPDPKIKYRDPNDKTNTYYDVDGNIIIRGEELKFTNNFKVYNLNDGTKLENISVYVNVDGSDIEYQISNSNYCSYQQLRKNNSADTDTRKITLSYSFEKEDGTPLINTYSFPNEIILGRIVSLESGKHYSIIKTQEGEIKYYLSDNGGDKDFPFGNTKLTSNQLIDLRKTGSVYFSLSRKPEEGSNLLAKEGLTISINDGAFKKTIFFTNDELSQSLLLELIELLYEGRTNVFSFFESKMFSDEEEESIRGLLKDKIKFSIELAYYYKIADDRQDDVKTVVFSITENELNFLKSVEPIGLRKKGVIINPIRKENENEDLGNDNTFIINVNDLKVSARDKNGKATKWERQNGIKIVFHTDETDGEDADGKPIPIILPTFEIYLGEDGCVHLSNCKIDEPPAAAET